MQTVATLLVRNEADRWLRDVLSQLRFLVDRVVVVDDASDDETVAICGEYTDEVHTTARSLFATHEYVQRRRVWDLATAGAKTGDWIVCFDADELLPDEDLEQLKMLLHYKHFPAIDSLSLNLYDMWSTTHYRDDQYWSAHSREWVSAVKFNVSRRYVWRETALHCGRFPLDAARVPGATGLKVKHMGWSREADRIRKQALYLASDPDGQFGWLEQYHSILDPHPNLVALA